MRIAIIGLGTIAQKAYLPIITARNDVELVFCTRNEAVLARLSAMYRVSEAVSDLNALLVKGVDAAFVHTATESHGAIASTLLQHGIHVYVDKPLAYSYQAASALAEVAQRSGRLLMVGFNRRFAPMYSSLARHPDRQFIMMQKNRTLLPDNARRFIFDDFIHVVDTLRYLAPGPIEDTRVTSLHHEGQLHAVMLHCAGAGWTASGLMNRNNGVTEETLELMNPGNKWAVRGLNTTVHYAAGQERVQQFNEWDSGCIGAASRRSSNISSNAPNRKRPRCSRPMMP